VSRRYATLQTVIVAGRSLDARRGSGNPGRLLVEANARALIGVEVTSALQRAKADLRRLPCDPAASLSQRAHDARSGRCRPTVPSRPIVLLVPSATLYVGASRTDIPAQVW
jgi:hypothetical protein